MSLSQTFRRKVFLIVLMVITSAGVFIALAIPFTTPLTEKSFHVGQVAQQDVRAPYSFSFESQYLTEKSRQDAARTVEPVYSQVDTSIARRQMERLRGVLAYIDTVRADAYAVMDEKVVDLSALENVKLRKETVQSILLLTDARWQMVKQESIIVLEQVMRAKIRDDRVDEARRSVPTLISLSISEEQAVIVNELIIPFIAANSLYDPAQTELARKQASEAVKPVERSYMAEETIVQRGQVIGETELEALKYLGLIEPRDQWQNLVSSGVLALLITAYLVFYVNRSRRLSNDLRGLSLVALLFLIFLFAARLILPGHTLVPYLFPMAVYSLTIAALFGVQPALFTTIPLAIASTYGLPFALELIIYYVVGSYFGVLILGRAQRFTSFFWAGFVIAFSGSAVTFIYRLPQPTTDWIGLVTLTVCSFFNGVASASGTLLLQFFLAQLLGTTTALQLIELSRPDHPLLQMILRNAPGTYQHSLQVANLAEQAAERIGADPLLTRVGALYHDAGKASAPAYYIENQIPGSENPHNSLDPAASASMVIDHVYKGLELARKYRLPRRVRDFIIEHHGDMLTRYQYARAIDEAGGDESKIDISKFRYPGPRPQSRETALLMLADGCEAKVRADRPKDEKELRILVKGVIDNAVSIGALNDTNLTLQDLGAILDSFTATLRGIYHPRIQYPELEKPNDLSGEASLDELDQPTQPIRALSIPPLSQSDPPTNSSS